MRLGLGIIATGLACAQISRSLAATYFVAPEGEDGNPGSSERPWKTIQKAADSVAAGDFVIVREGAYEERVNTSAGGTDESHRITFKGEGEVTVWGFFVDEPFVTIEGFDITGWSSDDRNDAQVEVANGGDFFAMIDCRMDDASQISAADIVFQANSNTITSGSANFVSAGFKPGQTIYIGNATNSQASVNTGVQTILEVFEGAIVVSGSLVQEGPLHMYLSAGYVFGVATRSGTEQCQIRGNVFSNLGYDVWFILGNGHIVEGNLIERVNGWDAMHFGGKGHVFRQNQIRTSPLVVYQVSPDAMENFAPSPYEDIRFENNYIEGFAGVLAAQKGAAGDSQGLHLFRNVFIDVGRFSFRHPGSIVEQNTFLRVAARSNPVTSRASHPIFVDSDLATNTVIRNNIFVDCGETLPSETEAEVGWYEFSGSTNTMVTTGNFVAGGPPAYAAKSGWLEADEGLNGGDPRFLNMGDPLGPDGAPFTLDDGLRLLDTSKLIGAGWGGLTPGAYEDPAGLPQLLVAAPGGGAITVSWVESWGEWVLQTSAEPADAGGAWVDVVGPPSTNGVLRAHVLETTDPSAVFRLGLK